MTQLIYAQHRWMLGYKRAVAAGQVVEKKAGLFHKNTYSDHPGLVEADIAAVSEVKASPAFEDHVDSCSSQFRRRIDLFSFS
jgi:hypothetical protein